MNKRLVVRLAFLELKGRLRGMGVFVTCVALGVMAVVSVGSLSESFLATLGKDGQVLLGGDVALVTRGRALDEEVLLWLKEEGESVSEVLSMQSMMVKEDRSEQQLVMLRLVDELYPLYGEVKMESGTWDGGANEGGLEGVMVSQDLALKWDLEVGEGVFLGKKLFEVRGIVGEPPDRSVRFSLFGPRVTLMREGIEGTGLIREGSLVRFYYRVKLGAGEDLQAFTDRLSAKFPKREWEVRTREGVDPNVESSINLVTEFMTLIALTIMLIGGVGVSNATRAFLGGRFEAIAILKCLGATREEIFWVCFLLVLWMSMLGSVLGSVLGVGLPYVVLPLLNEFLPIDSLPLISFVSIMLGWGLGFLVMLVFVLLSLSLATKESVSRLFRHNDGLVVWPSWTKADGWAKVGTVLVFLGLVLMVVWGLDNERLVLAFLGGVLVVYGIFYGMGRGLMVCLRALPRPKSFFVDLALASLYRPGNMTVAVLMSLGIGLTVLVSIAMVQGSVLQSVKDLEESEVPSFFLVDVQEDQRVGVERLVAGLGVEEGERKGVNFSPILRGRIVSMAGVSVDEIEAEPDYSWVLEGDRALTWDDEPEFTDENRLKEGKWWEKGYGGELLVSFDKGAADSFGLEVGDMLGVRVLGRDFEARIANLREVRWESLRMNFLMVFPESSFRGAPYSYLSAVFVPGSERVNFEKALVEEMPNVTPLRLDRFVEQFRRIFSGIASGISVMGWFAILTGVVVLGGVMLASHEARVGQATVYKVVGMTRGEFMRHSLWEFGLVGVVGALGGMVMGTVASYFVVTEVMSLSWQFSADVALYTGLGSLLVTLGIGFINVWYVQGRRVGQMLRNE